MVLDVAGEPVDLVDQDRADVSLNAMRTSIALRLGRSELRADSPGSIPRSGPERGLSARVGTSRRSPPRKAARSQERRDSVSDLVLVLARAASSPRRRW